MSPAAIDFYVTGGTLRQDAPSYVERRADKDLCEGLSRGEFCYVLTSRQMGKSSLMVHTAARLREERVRIVVLDLTAIGQNLSAEQWYGGLLRRLGRQLDPEGELEETLEEFWFEREARVGPLERWMAALQQIILPQVAGRIVIFIDEIDAVRSLRFSTDEFFAGIRECFNRRTQDPAFERLTFCLLGVATPSDLIQDTRTTPFNIGTRIDLTDFTAAEAAPLAEGLGVQAFRRSGVHEPTDPSDPSDRTEPERRNARTRERAPAERLLQRILHWTGGHPYLTQRLCQAVATDEAVTGAAAVDRLCEALFLSPAAREKDDNLLFVRERLLKSEADLASLLDLYGRVRRGQRVAVDDTNPLIDLLRLSGVARGAEGRLQVRNRIYERVFDQQWVVTHVPDAERRRQQAAYRRGLARATAIASAVLLVVLGLALTALREARRADRNARAEARARGLAEQRSYAAAMNLAAADWENANIERLRRLLDQTRESPYRGFEWFFWQRLCHLDQRTIRPQGPMAFFPDESRMALCTDERTVQVQDTATRRTRVTLKGHTVPVQAIAVFQDGRRIFTAAWAPRGPGGVVRLEMRVWDAASGRVLSSVTETASRPRQIEFAPGGPRVAIAGADDAVRVQDPTTGRKLCTLRSGKSAVWWLSLSRDGRRLLIADENGRAKLWEVGSGAGSAGGHSELASTGGAGTPRALLSAAVFTGLRPGPAKVLSPDGNLLLDRTGDPYAKGQVLDAATGRVLAYLGKVGLCGVAFSDDHRRLAVGGDEGSVQIWDTHRWKPPLTFSANPLPVRSLDFSPDGTRLATGGEDDTIRIWNARTGRALLTLKGHRDLVYSVRFSLDGRRLVGESDDGVAKLWDVTSDHEALTLPHPTDVTAAVFSPDGRWIATGSRDGWACVWDSRTGREITRFRAAPHNLTSVTFSPNGRQLITGRAGARVWDPATGRLIRSIRNPDLDDCDIVGSPDGKRFVASRERHRPSVWDLATGRKLYTFQAPFPGVVSSAFSPDGRRIATGSTEGAVWDTATGRRLLTLKGHEGEDGLLSVAYSPDGRRIITTGWDRTARVWDAATGRQLLVLRGHSRGVTHAAFSPDGQRIVTNSWDITTRLWNAVTGDELLTLRDTSGGAFSPDGRRLMAVSAGPTHAVKVWEIATPQQVAAWEAEERGLPSTQGVRP